MRDSSGAERAAIRTRPRRGGRLPKYVATLALPALVLIWYAARLPDPLSPLGPVPASRPTDPQVFLTGTVPPVSVAIRAAEHASPKGPAATATRLHPAVRAHGAHSSTPAPVQPVTTTSTTVSPAPATRTRAEATASPTKDAAATPASAQVPAASSSGGLPSIPLPPVPTVEPPPVTLPPITVQPPPLPSATVSAPAGTPAVQVPSVQAPSVPSVSIQPPQLP
jgi:hypothetical protein